jgi:VWFA-related protein
MRLTRFVVPFLVSAAVIAPRAASPADRTVTLAIQSRQQQKPLTPTLQVYSRETFVDVVVTDAKGNPVHGLTKADFTLLEDGKEMTAKSFEEHRGDLPVVAAAVQPAKIDLGPNSFTNFSPTPAKAGPLNILLLDSLNTPTQSQQIVVQRMLDYIKNMPPGTRMAVLNLSTHLTILQGFTSDRDLLKAAVTNKKVVWAEPIFEDPGWEGLQPPVPEDPGVMVEKEGNFAGMRGQHEMSAMRQIALYVSGMPGRKNLIWFAGSFPLQFPPVPDGVIFPDPGVPPGVNPPPPMQKYDFSDEMKSAIDVLARSHVAVYPIDGRGVEDLPPPPPAICVRSISCMTNKANMSMAEHTTMDLIADRTGGKAFYNTNGLAEAVQQAVDLGSNFYTLTYVPTNETLDTRFRKIAVKVARAGLHLTYREGYYAVDPATDARGNKVVPDATAMQTALLRGAPEPTEIIFKARVVPAAATEVELPANNKADPKQMKPPYRRYDVWYAAGIRNVQFTTDADGKRHGSLELTVLVYNADGEIVNSTATVLRPSLTAAQYASMLQTGMITSQQIAVPAKGDFFLRIAVHDLGSDKVGAVEVPTSAIRAEGAPALATGR